MSAPTVRPAAQSPAAAPPPRRRLKAVLLAAGSLVAAAAVLAVLVLSGALGGRAPGRAADADPAMDPGHSVPLSSSAPTAVPSRVVARAPGLPERLPPVALSQNRDLGNGLRAQVTGLRSFTAHARERGEIAGPALAVTVRLTNTSPTAASLDTAAVSLYRGRDGVRASVVYEGATPPFSGSLAPQASAQATYVFSVPLDQRDVVTVTVGTSPDSGTAVFSGPAA